MRLSFLLNKRGGKLCFLTPRVLRFGSMDCWRSCTPLDPAVPVVTVTTRFRAVSPSRGASFLFHFLLADIANRLCLLWSPTLYSSLVVFDFSRFWWIYLLLFLVTFLHSVYPHNNVTGCCRNCPVCSHPVSFQKQIQNSHFEGNFALVSYLSHDVVESSFSVSFSFCRFSVESWDVA